MQHYFHTTGILSMLLLVVGTTVSCSATKHYAKEDGLSILDKNMPGAIPWVTSNEKAKLFAYKQGIRDSIRVKYNAHCPYKIDGSSQAAFNKGKKFVKKCKISHIRYICSCDYNFKCKKTKLHAAQPHMWIRFNPIESPSCSEHIDHIKSLLQLDHISSLEIVDEKEEVVIGFNLSNSFLVDREIGLLLNKLSSNNKAQLKFLNLSNNYLTTVKDFPNLPQLKFLNLSNNYLTTVKDFPNLPQLKSLDLSNNQLKTVKGLPSLPQLEEINFSNNRLKKIELSAKPLKLGCFSINRFTSVTRFKKLDNFPKLACIDIKNNPLVNVGNYLEHLVQNSNLSIISILY